MFETGTPHSGQEMAAALTRLVAEGHRYLDALPAETFFAPQGDRWSPAEHVRHLRKSTAPVTRALRLPWWILRLRFGRGPGGSRGFATVREVYLGALARGGQAGRFAPGPEPAPADPAARRAAIMRAWRAAAQDLEAAAARWSEPALDRAWLPHPLIGLLTVREMLGFTVYHTAHHLTQVARRQGVAGPGGTG